MAPIARLARPVLLSLLVALTAPGSLFAQEEPSFADLTRNLQRRFEELSQILELRERELKRHLQIVERLVQGGVALAREAPATGRAAAFDAVAEARALASQDPELDPEVFAILDRCDVELEREPFGESPPSAAVRYLSEILPMEEEATRWLVRYSREAASLRRQLRAFDELGAAQIEAAAVALQRLQAAHGTALGVREGRP